MRRYGGEGGKDFGGYASGGEHVRLGAVLSGCSGYGSYLWRGRCFFLFASRQRRGISDPQSGTGSSGDWLGADDLLHGGRGCILDISGKNGDLIRSGPETLRGASGISTCAIRMATSYRLRVRSNNLPAAA